MRRHVKFAAATIIVATVIVLILIGADLSWNGGQKEASEGVMEETPSEALEQGELPEAERQRIQEWIEDNDLNRYGDPKNRFHPGGTPLFNEGTGETIDLYQYMLGNHPDRPWLE